MDTALERVHFKLGAKWGYTKRNDQGQKNGATMDEQSLRHHLLAEAEKAIDEMLKKKAAPDKITLSEIEDLVGQLGKQLEQKSLEALVEVSSNPKGVCCPQCGGEVRGKGRRSRQVVTVRGEVKIEREYYYCSACQQGFFPLGSTLGTERECDE